MKRINGANLTTSLLLYAMDHAIFSEADTLENIMRKTRAELLQLHNHSIYQRESDGRWVTKLGRHKPYARLVRVNKADLENDLIQYYLSETKGNLTFEECFNLWMESEEASANPGISPKSITNYRAEYKRFLEGHSFCSLMMADIKDSDLHNLLFDIVERPDKISRKRFNSVKSLLTKVFDYARMRLGMNVLYSRQILKEMVFKPNQFLITDKKQQIFYQKDLIPFLNYLAKQNTLISLGIAFTAQTGLRVSEIAAISWEDVHGHSIHICRAEHSWTESDGTRHVEIGLPKEYKFRDVILSDEAKALLTKIREIHPTQTGYLFLNNGVRATCRMFDYYIRKYCKACDIPVLSMHKLRKTYASVLLASGFADKVVQSQLGHADIATTQNHYNYNPYLEDEQVAIFKGANIMLPPVSPPVP